MLSSKEIAAAFSKIDVHDDTVENVNFLPAISRRSTAALDVTLFRYWENRRRLIHFGSVANFSINTDAEVLRDNSPNNTACAEASAVVSDIQRFMQSQKPLWNVRYDTRDPLSAKLASANRYVLFRLRLFGGNIVIVARSFSVRHLNRRSSGLRGSKVPFSETPVSATAQLFR